MGNSKIIQYYDNLAKKIKSANETRNKAKDFSDYDVSFMKQFADKDKILLDLGAGTGLLINHLIDDFKKIIAVEKYKNFSDFIVKHDNVEILNKDLLDFDFSKLIKEVNVVSLFGVMNYFNLDESKLIYKKVFKSLNTGGILVVKNQMGICDDVTVEGYSKELESDYYSNYRQVDNEVRLLEGLGFKDIQKYDIYPSEYNRWDNTHFYALVVKKL